MQKSDSRCTVVRFCYRSNDYRPNWVTLSPITIAKQLYNKMEVALAKQLYLSVLPLLSLLLFLFHLRYHPQSQSFVALMLHWKMYQHPLNSQFPWDQSFQRDCFVFRWQGLLGWLIKDSIRK